MIENFLSIGVNHRTSLQSIKFKENITTKRRRRVALAFECTGEALGEQI